MDKKQKISLEFDKECDNLDIAFQSDEKGIINKHFELTIKVVDKIEIDNEYKHIQTSIEEMGDTIYVHRSFVND